MNKNIGDIDIDCLDRNKILSKIKHIVAINKDGTKHKTGVYVQDVKVDPIRNTAYYNFEEESATKIDFLHLNILENFRSNNQLLMMAYAEPIWELLEHEEIVQKLPQIHAHFDIIKTLKPKSVEQLAMTLAIIRPAKRYLKNKTWNEIEKQVWKQEENQEYSFKKSHAIAYSLMIVALLNRMCEE